MLCCNDISCLCLSFCSFVCIMSWDQIPFLFFRSILWPNNLLSSSYKTRKLLQLSLRSDAFSFSYAPNFSRYRIWRHSFVNHNKDYLHLLDWTWLPLCRRFLVRTQKSAASCSVPACFASIISWAARRIYVNQAWDWCNLATSIAHFIKLMTD